MEKTQRVRVLEDIVDTLDASPLFKTVVLASDDASIGTLSRFDTPLVLVRTGEALEREGALSNTIVRQDLPVIITIGVSPDDGDEEEVLSKLEFEAKRLLYLNRRRGGYAISTNYVSTNETPDVFESSLYDGRDVNFSVMYQEDLSQ